MMILRLFFPFVDFAHSATNWCFFYLFLVLDFRGVDLLLDFGVLFMSFVFIQDRGYTDLYKIDG